MLPQIYMRFPYFVSSPIFLFLWSMLKVIPTAKSLKTEFLIVVRCSHNPCCINKLYNVALEKSFFYSVVEATESCLIKFINELCASELSCRQ
jgi:hypothetical protein